jgi:Secretion system C-terminal sorting domain
MKKLLLALVFLVSAKMATAQDTLLFEDFNNVINFNYEVAPSNGTQYDASGYNFDADGLIDANDRAPEWFLILPFAVQDSLTTDGDTNIALASSSWFDPAGQALNYFMLPSIQLNDASAFLSFKSAPRQTPLYCDGFKVLVSTTDNFETSYTDTLFVAGEYISRVDPLPDSTFAGFTFSEGDVHGLDGQFVEYGGDSIRLLGVLKPHNISLAAYAGQKIFIAFLHDADDDNLISIDDILVYGDGTVNVDENKATVEVAMYPNPTNDVVNLNFNVVRSGPVSLEVYDLAGKQVDKLNIGARMKGQHTYQFSVAGYPAGSYMVSLRTLDGVKTLNLAVTK